MRAIALLAQREHSPVELRRKLLRIGLDMRKEAARLSAERVAERDDERVSDQAEPPDGMGESAAASVQTEVDALLVFLQAQGYLSESRFVDSRINARASRYGSLRIKQELAQHGLALDAEKHAALRASEAERARAVWQRKFGADAMESAAADASKRARQMRFLTGRGFAPDTVRRLMRSAAED